MTIYLILTVISVIFIIMGAYLLQKGVYLLSNGKTAEAIIFKNNFRRSGSNNGMYYPVVRFLTDKQEWITKELNIGYSSAKLEGTKIEVIYDPYDPDNVELNSWFYLKIAPQLFIFFGFVGLIVGLLKYLDII